MSIEIKTNFDFKDLEDQIRKELERTLEVALFAELTVLKSRLLSGVDIKGRAVASYAPYTPQYAKRRKKHGRITSKVDWSFTGGLIRSLLSKVTSTNKSITGTISAKGKEKIIEGLIKKRPLHWGLTDKQAKRISTSIQNNLKL